MSAEYAFTDAPFWWAGTARNWARVWEDARLSETQEVPDAENELLVVVYELRNTTADVPGFRLEASMLLGDAERANSVHKVGMFALPAGTRLTAFGFQDK